MIPEQQTENVVRSLYAYINANFTTTPAYLLGQHEFDTTTLSEWVEFELGTAARRFVRHVDGSRPHLVGNIVSYYLDAVIYVRPTPDVMRIVRLRDIVSDLFQQASIPIYDYAGNNATNTIGALVGHGLIVDLPLGFKDDQNRWTLSFDMKHIEAFNG